MFVKIIYVIFGKTLSTVHFISLYYSLRADRQLNLISSEKIFEEEFEMRLHNEMGSLT